MCAVDNHNHENGAYYVSSRNVVREDVNYGSNPMSGNYLRGSQNA